MGVRLFRCVRARESQKRNISENIKLEDAQRSNEEFEIRRGVIIKKGAVFEPHIYRTKTSSHLFMYRPTHV